MYKEVPVIARNNRAGCGDLEANREISEPFREQWWRQKLGTIRTDTVVH